MKNETIFDYGDNISLRDNDPVKNEEIQGKMKLRKKYVHSILQLLIILEVPRTIIIMQYDSLSSHILSLHHF